MTVAHLLAVQLGPLLVIGGLVFMVGFAVFAGTLFRHGGLPRTMQFRVLGELSAGSTALGLEC